MRKIITIAILFFSYFSYSQVKSIENQLVEKTGASSACSITVLNNYENAIILKSGDGNCENINRRRSNEITENPLNNIKLVLPNTFNWLLHSIASSDKITIQLTSSENLVS